MTQGANFVPMTAFSNKCLFVTQGANFVLIRVHAVWSHPPGGVLKLNVDSAFVAQSGKAGNGLILRRSDGSIVFSSCRDLHRQSCMEGLRFALDMCQERVSVETES